ncbi:MAG: methionine adenosyltransferase [Oscillospiraceae bacterium]|nr:methionine adenosyltransferase [Oscillospiraceae bacterium]MDD4546400.1 methionine adenosyltransferase [Oscillospiraceae bacterium]
MAKRFFTSESVTEGHPDKVCDQIADAVLDAILEQDTTAHVACECIATTGLVLVMGEISTSCYVDIPRIARQVIREIGYDNAAQKFDGNTCAVLTAIDEQSPDIAMGVNQALETRESSGAEYDRTGAGDQGIMFGYACDETPELMPLPISLAHKMAKRLAELRKSGQLPYLRPDGKTQVTVEYDDGTPVRVDTVVVSTQHSEEIALELIHEDIVKHVILPVIPEALIDDDTKIFVNPTGRFVVGGPQGDSGLTGRKLIVDTYGGYARHGGGAFSGKDPTKVDRSASYMARYAAKNVVAAGLAKQCELQLAYAIGVAHPVSILIDTNRTGVLPDEQLAAAVSAVFDFRPAAIIDYLNLAKPIYRNLASYGHIGREDLGVAWEKTDKTQELRDYLGL